MTENETHVSGLEQAKQEEKYTSCDSERGIYQLGKR